MWRSGGWHPAVQTGYANGATLAAGGSDWLASVGATTAVFVLTALLPAMVLCMKEVCCRALAGSWVAAIGMLTLGWPARGK